MGFAPHYDEIEVTPPKRRGTKKKIWNDELKEWQEVTIWTVSATQDLCDWLQKEYPGFNGWSYVWSQTKVAMEERIYIFHCLKFEL